MSKHAPWHTQPHKPRGFGSSLTGIAATAPASPDQLWAMRRRAWRDTGVAVLRPDDIADDFARQAVVNVAEKLFGPRPTPPRPKLPDDKPLPDNRPHDQPPHEKTPHAKPLHEKTPHEKTMNREEGAR